MRFKDKVIPIWMICYDGDADRIYSFTNFDKAVASIEGAVRSYFGEEGPEFDQLCGEVTDKIRELRTAPCIPLRFDNLDVVVYNWEIDSTNPIHKILSDCHDTAGDVLKEKIKILFAEPVR
jgi:hypothetical protein